MERSRPIWRCVWLGIGLFADALLILVWSVRPAPSYAYWLTWIGDPQTAPLRVVRSWAGGKAAPLTPSGLCWLFEPQDFVVTAALLMAFVVLSGAFALAWSGWNLHTEAGVLLRRLGVGRLRVRTALVAVALIALYLGWELNAWRSWELWRRYYTRAQDHARNSTFYSETLRTLHAQLSGPAPSFYAWPEDTRTPEARAADRAFWRDSLQARIACYEAMRTAAIELNRKYVRAAEHPLEPVEPDPPPPNASDPDLPLAMTGSDLPARLNGYTEQARRYPALVSAHHHRAWILATCPDASLRDGNAAVAAATRACALTNWQHPELLATLAAAYAESGDFPRAIEWQERAIQRRAAIVPDTQWTQTALKQERERLDRYKSGKPYRDAKLR